MDAITIDGHEYVRQIPEHGTVRGRRARTNVNGVWYVRLDRVSRKTDPRGITVADFVEHLLLLDFDDVIPGIREAISTRGDLLRSNNGAQVGTLIDLARSAMRTDRVTLNGVPVIDIDATGVTTLEKE